MAEELPGAGILEIGLTAGPLSAWIRINDRPLAGRTLGAIGAFGLAGGIGLAIFYRRNPDLVNNAIRRALEALGRALNFRGGSVVFELRCDAELFSRLSMESFTIEIKQRVEEAFQEIGFFKELEVTVMNTQEVYDRVNPIRYDHILYCCGSYTGNEITATFFGLLLRWH